MKQNKLNKAIFDRRQAIRRGDNYKFICLVLSFGFAAYAGIDNKTFIPLILLILILTAIKFKRIYDEKAK